VEDTSEVVEIDEELDAAIEEAIASSARGEAIPWAVSFVALIQCR
jgi:hypothetical protein